MYLFSIPVQLHSAALQAAVGEIDVGEGPGTATHTGLKAGGTLASGGVQVRPKGTRLHTQPACHQIDEVGAAVNTVLWALRGGAGVIAFDDNQFTHHINPVT